MSDIRFTIDGKKAEALIFDGKNVAKFTLNGKEMEFRVANDFINSAPVGEIASGDMHYASGIEVTSAGRSNNGEVINWFGSWRHGMNRLPIDSSDDQILLLDGQFYDVDDPTVKYNFPQLPLNKINQSFTKDGVAITIYQQSGNDYSIYLQSAIKGKTFRTDNLKVVGIRQFQD